MKRLFSCVALVLLFATVGFGQSIKDQIVAINAEAAPLVQKRAELQTAVKAIDQTNDDIKDGVATLHKYAAKLESDKTAYKMEESDYIAAVNQQNAVVDAHNANRCVAPSDNPGVCAAYNAEAARINSAAAGLAQQKAKVDQDYDFVENTRKQLVELSQVLSDKTVKWTSDVKKWNDENNANEEKLTELHRRFQQLVNSLGDCLKQAGENATDETLHAVCGAKWDGNTNMAPVRNQGTGGITPNSN
jgi:chromosome segregation ATPase